MIRRMYEWVLHWAETPYGAWALFFLAVAESSFFPIPPDVLLIALAVSIPSKAFKYALICTTGSVIGGVIGYGIGFYSMQAIGMRIIEFYGLGHKYDYAADLYRRYDALTIFVAGFTPLPFKVLTISGGALKINFFVFVAASAMGRATRFLLVGALIYRFGDDIRNIIDRYFNLMTIIFTILLIGGFLILSRLL
ncbi:MAG: VTT domain-containing protein [Syntrophales bacterium]|nr:VTT domain-containing protein [Syntrophales bacterium]